jgi:glycosyltransferase involved in cell wall biosynthesis
MRVLIISIHYPPIIGMSSRAMAELSKALVADGHSVDVLTVDPVANHPVYKWDFGEMQRVPHQVNVHRVPMGPINRLSGRLAVGGDAKPDPQATSEPKRTRSMFRRLYAARNLWGPFAIPDASIDWLPGALLEARRMIRRKPYDAVVSLGNPHTCHLVAYLATRRCDTAWTAVYGDGWGTDPSLELCPVWNRRLNQLMERRVVKAAAQIVVCSEGVIPHLVKAYDIDASKISLVRFSFFDPDPYESAESLASNSFRMVYTGAVYPIFHQPIPLLRAMKRCAARGINLAIVGPDQESLEAEARKLQVPNIEFCGWHPHREAIAQQKTASVVLLFGHRGGQQLPSKLFEYFAARRPILCIAADDDDVAARLIREQRRGMVVPNSEAAIAEALDKLLELHKGGILDASFDLDELPEYTPQRAVSELMRVLTAERSRQTPRHETELAAVAARAARTSADA